MVKRGFFVSLLGGWLLPQHLEAAPGAFGGQRPNFKGENAQERPWKTHVHIRLSPSLKRQIIHILSEPYTEFVSIPLSRLRHLCRFEKGGYCKKIRGACEPQKCPEIPKGE